MAGHAFVYSGVKYRLKFATPEETTNSGAAKISGIIFDLFTFVNSILRSSKKLILNSSKQLSYS